MKQKWRYFRDFVGAQKIEDLSESKNFFADVFQITSRFDLANKKFGDRRTLKIIDHCFVLNITSKIDIITSGEKLLNADWLR